MTKIKNASKNDIPIYLIACGRCLVVENDVDFEFSRVGRTEIHRVRFFINLVSNETTPQLHK